MVDENENEQKIIKDVVNEKANDKGDRGSTQEIFVPSPGQRRVSSSSIPGYEEMQPSIMEKEREDSDIIQTQQTQTQEQDLNAVQDANYEGYPMDYNYGSNQQVYEQYGQAQIGEGYGGYSPAPGTDYGQQYQPYQEVMSSDIITEISEQVVDEKLSGIRDKVENAINFRTIAEGKINAVDKRLRRIEQVLDILQISLIQKVSEYVTDVKDMKNELQETQKSIKVIAPHLKSHHTHSETHHTTYPHHVRPTHSHKSHATEHHSSHSHHTTHKKGKKRHTP